jgi:hypothetical protein
VLLQPMWETFGHVHAASAEVGRTTAALLAGDDRGHVPAQLEEADDAMRELIRARREVPPLVLWMCVRLPCGLFWLAPIRSVATAGWLDA